MADFIVIDLDGEASLQQRIGHAMAAVQQPRALMEAIGQRLVSNVELRFETKTDPNGLAWLPLADSTRERYERQDKGRRRGSLLQRSGLMLASLTESAGPDSVTVGFGRPYAIWHILGTSRMPRRDPLFGDPTVGRLGDGDRQDVIDELQEFLADAFGGR